MESYTQELWDTIMSILNRFRVGVAYWEEVGLTFPQTTLLMELKKAGRCSMGELSRRLRVTQSVATRMVDLLIEKGLVERSGDDSDRRLVLVENTVKGTEIAQEIEGTNRRRMGELMAAVSETERLDFLGFLKRFERLLEEEEEEEEAT